MNFSRKYENQKSFPHTNLVHVVINGVHSHFESRSMFLCLSKIYPPEGTSLDFPRHIERVKSTLTSYFNQISTVQLFILIKKNHQTKRYNLFSNILIGI